MTTIAFTADNHLGFRQYGFEEREEDRKKAFLEVTNYCRDNTIPLVISGDLLHTAKPTGELALWVANSIKGQEVFGIDGNHDNAENNWLKLCGIESIHNRYVCINDIGIVGMNYCRPAIFMEELDKLIEVIRTFPVNTVDIVTFHQLIDDFVPYNSKQISAAAIEEKLRPFGITYVILGDIHKDMEKKVGDITFLYTGSTELGSIDESPNKSFVLIERASTGAKLTHKRIPIHTRPVVNKFIQVEKDLDDVLQTYCKAGDHPLIVLEYDNNNKELAKRAELALTGKAMLKLVPVVQGEHKSLMTQLSTEGFARYGAINHLRNSISAFFNSTSDEYQLVTQLLDTPDDVDQIITKYGKQKGLL